MSTRYNVNKPLLFLQATVNTFFYSTHYLPMHQSDDIFVESKLRGPGRVHLVDRSDS